MHIKIWSLELKAHVLFVLLGVAEDPKVTKLFGFSQWKTINIGDMGKLQDDVLHLRVAHLDHAENSSLYYA